MEIDAAYVICYLFVMLISFLVNKYVHRASNKQAAGFAFVTTNLSFAIVYLLVVWQIA